MNWTTERPTVPGWYWVRGVENPTYAVPLLNEPDLDFQGDVFQKAAAHRYYGAQFGYGQLECSGPIPIPDEQLEPAKV